MWGHDFRKSYGLIAEFIDNLRIRPVVTAFTATKNRSCKKGCN